MPRRITEQKIHLGKLYKVYRTVHCSVSIKPKMGLKINPFYYRQFQNVAGCLCRPNLDPVLSENKTFFHDAFKGDEQKYVEWKAKLSAHLQVTYGHLYV